MSSSSRKRLPNCAARHPYLAQLLHCAPLAQLDRKIARARAHDAPVHYADALAGLDLLLCPIAGARPPYPGVADLRRECIESVVHALELPLAGLRGGYWYELNGIGCLVLASEARGRVLNEFCA
jgi:hypothetical protein